MAPSLKPRHLLIRSSGAAHVGLGHLMRSLAVAQAAAEVGWQVSLYGTVPDFVAPRWAGFSVTHPNHDESDVLKDWQDPAFLALLAQADGVLTDLYAIGDPWRQRLTRPVVVVSDPPHWPQVYDLLVLPTVFAASAHVVPTGALCAPVHCLISRDICAYRPLFPPPADQPARLLISCGGGEDLGLAARCMTALADDLQTAQVQGTVILGTLSEERRVDALAAAARVPGLQVLEQVTNMGAVMAGHTVAFGTPAGAALERACLGMAQVLVPIVDNQRALAAGLTQTGVAQVLAPDATGADLRAALMTYLTDGARRASDAAQAWKIIDGGGAAAVVSAIERVLRPSRL